MNRREVLADGEVQVVHCINRCVRRGFLCGDDAVSGKNYDHRRQWIQNRLEFLAGVFGVELLGFSVMGNHWHLVVWSRKDEDLSRFTGWLTLTHTQRWHAHQGTTGSRHVYQGRFKSFPVQDDEHFYTVCRHVERNALRAGLVKSADEWRWSSLHIWQHGTTDQKAQLLSEWPLPRKRS